MGEVGEKEGFPAEVAYEPRAHGGGIRERIPQGLNSSGLACYAIWENGRISWHSTAYEVEASVAKVRVMPVPELVRHELVTLLQTGHLAESSKPHVQHAILQR